MILVKEIMINRIANLITRVFGPFKNIQHIIKFMLNCTIKIIKIFIAHVLVTLL